LFEELEIDVSDIQKITSTIYKKAIHELCKCHLKSDCSISISFNKKDITYHCTFTIEDLDEMLVENSMSNTKSSPKQLKPTKDIVEKKENGVPTTYTNADEFKSHLNFSKLNVFLVDDINMIEKYKEECEDYIKDTKKDKDNITINKLYKHYIENYKGRKNAPELFVELVNHFEIDNQKVFVQIFKTKGNEVCIYKTLELKSTNDELTESEEEDEEQFSDDD